MMAAIRAGQLGKKVALIERNDSLGRKLLLTGNGRCNLTNTAPPDVFIEKFSPKGEFLRSAFFLFSNEDLIEFFQSKGLQLKVEAQGCVFPDDDKARSVLSVLEEYLKENKIEIIFNSRIVNIEQKNGAFVLVSQDNTHLESKKVILATGGISYTATGSTGDGFDIAGRLGHNISAFKPALVALVTKEKWVKDLQGLSFSGIRIIFRIADKKIISDFGALIFTHFGVSGPLVLDISGALASALENQKEIKMAIDLNPKFSPEQLEDELASMFVVRGATQIKILLQEMVPKRMALVLLELLNISEEKRAGQITKKERHAIMNMLKAFSLTITGSLPIEEAMATNGGVCMKNINPRTMSSRLVRGLYFAGEMIDCTGKSGGYNLQQAFSTGYLAGQSAAGLTKK